MLRRLAPSRIDRLLLVVFVVFVVVTLGRALIGNELLIDANILTRFPPWQAVNGAEIKDTNVCRSDTVDNIMPGIMLVRDALFSGHYATWNQYSVGGVSMGAPNVGQFSPLSLPYYVLPLWLAPAFVKLGQFIVIVVGMVAFLRRLKLTTAAGVLAGIIFCTSGFMIQLSNWPQTQVAALIPALFWATEFLAQKRRVRHALPLACVIASMLLGGFPAVTGMAMYFAAVYFLVRLVVLSRGRSRNLAQGMGSAVVGIVLGVLLSAFQLLPFARQLSDTDLTYREASKGAHSTLDSLVTLVSPDAQGTCVAGVDNGSSVAIDSVAFVGAAAVVLALVAVVWPARHRVAVAIGRRADRHRGGSRPARGAIAFMAVSVAVTVVIVWFGGPLLTAVQLLPVFSNNPISRMRSLLGFLMAVLAGFGFERLIAAIRGPQDGSDATTPEPRATTSAARRRWVGRVVVVAAVLAVGLAVLVSARGAANDGGYRDYFNEHLTWPLVVVVVTALLVVVVRFGRSWVGAAATVLIAFLVIAQGTSFAMVDLGGSSKGNFYPVMPTHGFLQANLGEDRFASSGLTALPATAPFYHLRTPTGHQFTSAQWWDLLRAVDPLVALSPTYSDFSAKTLSPANVGRIPLLDQLSVKYWVAPDYQVPGEVRPPTGQTGAIPVVAGQTAGCPVPSGPLRAVVVNVAGPLAGSTTGGGATIRVVLHTPSGDLTGGRYLGGGFPAASQVTVAVPGEDLKAGTALTADIIINGISRPVSLGAVGGIVGCGTVTSASDGLKLVKSDPGALVYQRLSSLPRVRWASTSTVLADATQRVASLTRGLGPDTVVLGAAGPLAEGKPAVVDVTADEGGTVAATVNAQGAGYLVVADSMQQDGWSVTVDGEPAALVPADHAFGAVMVPAGTHKVVVSYTVPGLRTGTLLSLVAVVTMMGILVFSRRWRRAQRGQSRRRETVVWKNPERGCSCETCRSGAMSQRGGHPPVGSGVNPPRDPGHRRDHRPHHR